MACPIFNLGSKPEDFDGKSKEEQNARGKMNWLALLLLLLHWARRSINGEGGVSASSTGELHVEISFCGRGHAQFLCRYDGNSCIAGILCNIK